MKQELLQVVEHLHKLIGAACFLVPLFGLLIVVSLLVAKSVVICQFRQLVLAGGAMRFFWQFVYGFMGSLFVTGVLVCIAVDYHASTLSIVSSLVLSSLIFWLFLRWKFQALDPLLQPLWKSRQPEIIIRQDGRTLLREVGWKWLSGALFLFALLWVPDKMLRPWMVWIIPGYYLVRSVFLAIKYLLKRKQPTANN